MNFLSLLVLIPLLMLSGLWLAVISHKVVRGVMVAGQYGVTDFEPSY